MSAQFPFPSFSPRIARTEQVRRDLERARAHDIATKAPRIPWATYDNGKLTGGFIKDHLQWRRGEHFALIGPTGTGKTHMMINLLPEQRFVTAFATKPRDATMDALINQGYRKMTRWQSVSAIDVPRRVLWPDASRIGARTEQRKVFHDAFDRIFREGGWTVAIDELWYFTNILKLAEDVKMYLLQGRSLDISLLSATQRPAFVPLEIYDQSTHLMFWRDNDERNLSRISGLSIQSGNLVRAIVSTLEEHQVLYVNTRTGEMLRTRAPSRVTVKPNRRDGK